MPLNVWNNLTEVTVIAYYIVGGKNSPLKEGWGSMQDKEQELYHRYNVLPTEELQDILYDIEMSASLTLGMNVSIDRLHKSVLRKILQERGVKVDQG
jgi:hypothetical protein